MRLRDDTGTIRVTRDALLNQVFSGVLTAGGV